MVILMFPHSDEDVAYWSAEAAEAHAYVMLCYKIRRSHGNRCNELGQFPDWDYLREIDKAQAVFRVQYYLALAQQESASQHLSAADLDF